MRRIALAAIALFAACSPFSTEDDAKPRATNPATKTDAGVSGNTDAALPPPIQSPFDAGGDANAPRCAAAQAGDFCETFDERTSLDGLWNRQEGAPARIENKALVLDVPQAGPAAFVTKNLPKGTKIHVELRLSIETTDTTGGTTLVGVSFLNPAGLAGYFVSLIRRPADSPGWQLEEVTRTQGDQREVLNLDVAAPAGGLVELDIDTQTTTVTVRFDNKQIKSKTLALPSNWTGEEIQLGFPYIQNLTANHRAIIDDVYLAAR